MAVTKRIPIPWKARVRRWCYSVLPVAGFLLCVIVTGWMWRWQTDLPQLIGEVEAVRVEVLTGTNGQLTGLPQGNWTLFDRVHSGTVIARLDNRPALAEMETLRAERTQLRSELIAAEETIRIEDGDREHERQREWRRLVWQTLELRLNTLDRQTLLETDRLELARLNRQLAYLQPLLLRGGTTEAEVVDKQLERDVVQQRIDENAKALAEAENQLKWNTQRLKGFAELRATSTLRLLAPLEAAVTVQERRMDVLRVTIEGLEIRAPISGTIAAIHAWPGQNVQTGQPIVTLAAEQGRYIVSYVRQTQRLQPEPGMPVALRVRGTIQTPIPSTIERVGPQVELIPPHQCRNPAVPEWGLPIRIEMPNDLQTRPGELVDVIVKSGGHSSAS